MHVLFQNTDENVRISIGNSTSCSSINTASNTSKLDNFEMLQAGIISKYSEQPVLLFVYSIRQTFNPTRV